MLISLIFFKGHHAKYMFVFVALIFASIVANSQGIGINEAGDVADPSAILDVKSFNKGILVPRMPMAQRDLIDSPAQGLLIYQTDSEAGYYYYKGTAWTRIGEAAEIVTQWQSLGDDIYYQNGKVGIGTDSPAAPLEVSSLIRLTPSGLVVSCVNGTEGSIYYDNYYKEFCYCNGQYWLKLNGGGYCGCPDTDNDGYDICPFDHPYGTDGVDEDCDDSDPDVYPGAVEICDNRDNDCDGLVDNDAMDAIMFYADIDNDGWGDELQWLLACNPPNGYTLLSGDCDDYNSNTYPGAPEICDFMDNDCDQEIDEEAIDALIFYLDQDGDSYGNDNILIYSCLQVPGYVLLGGDCDDNNPDVNPGATEICNGVDDDCDQDIDDEAYCPSYPHMASTCNASSGTCSYECYTGWLDCNNDIELDGCEYMLPAYRYQDSDGDGYGNPLVSQEAYDCPVPGWSDNNLDCDDSDPDINPGESEICGDTIDNDCDGLTDGEDPDCI